MRAVVGSVTSSKPISVSKAAGILSFFASKQAGEVERREEGAPSRPRLRRDLAAYLNRASTAFDELAQFHRDLRQEQRNKRSQQQQQQQHEETTAAAAARRKEEGSNGVADADRDGRGNIEVKRKKSLKNRGDGNVSEDVKKAKKSGDEVMEEENVKELQRDVGVLDGGKYGDGKKKRDREEAGNDMVSGEEERDGKKRKNLSEEGGGSDIHKRKKKRRKN